MTLFSKDEMLAALRKLSKASVRPLCSDHRPQHAIVADNGDGSVAVEIWCDSCGFWGMMRESKDKLGDNA